MITKRDINKIKKYLKSELANDVRFLDNGNEVKFIRSGIKMHRSSYEILSIINALDETKIRGVK